MFDLKEKHDINELHLETPNKKFFTNNFIIILGITTMTIPYMLCKHNILWTLVASLALKQVKEVSTVATKKEGDNYMCDCLSQFYIILALSITIIG